MAQFRSGWLDAQQDSRLNWLRGTTYPAAPGSVFAAFYTGGLVLPDGTTQPGSAELIARQSVTFSAPTTDSGIGDHPSRRYIANSGALSITPPGAVGSGFTWVTGWALFSASSGGVAIYVEQTPGGWQLPNGVAFSVGVGQLRAYAEYPD